MVVLVLMTTARLDSPGRLLRSRSASPSGRSTGRSARSWYTDSGPKGTLHDHCLFLKGEEEPGPKGAERGGYSPIPRRDARVGEWVKIETI